MSTKLANLALHCYLLDHALASQRRVFERKRTLGWGGYALEDWTIWAHNWAHNVSVPNARHK